MSTVPNHTGLYIVCVAFPVIVPAPSGCTLSYHRDETIWLSLQHAFVPYSQLSNFYIWKFTIWIWQHGVHFSATRVMKLSLTSWWVMIGWNIQQHHFICLQGNKL